MTSSFCIFFTQIVIVCVVAVMSCVTTVRDAVFSNLRIWRICPLRFTYSLFLQNIRPINSSRTQKRLGWCSSKYSNFELRKMNWNVSGPSTNCASLWVKAFVRTHVAMVWNGSRQTEFCIALQLQKFRGRTWLTKFTRSTIKKTWRCWATNGWKCPCWRNSP